MEVEPDQSVEATEVGNADEKETMSSTEMETMPSAEIRDAADCNTGHAEGEEMDAEAGPASEGLSEASSSACLFDFGRAPSLLGQAKREFSSREDNFLRGCEWAPDGRCLLTCSNDNVLRVFDLPPSVYGQQPVSSEAEVTEMTSVLSSREGELIYDYCWYPKMNSEDPTSCLYLSSCRDHPIHAWDAYTGSLRCSYRAYNHLDEITAAHSIQFSSDGSKIYCGFDRTLRVFDTSRPGRECTQRRLTSKRDAGLRGIVSCIGVYQHLYALGSYSKSIGVYSERGRGERICVLTGQHGGVTHLQFCNDGLHLLSGGRKDNEILCWDLRNPGQVLWSAIRLVTTNQRVQFDMDQSGRYLFSGGQDGHVRIYDTTQQIEPSSSAGSAVTDGADGDGDGYGGDLQLAEVCRVAVHDDAVNGCRLHPTAPMLATTSGQRKFANPGGRGDGSDSDDGETNAGGAADAEKSQSCHRDNSMRLWSFAAAVQPSSS